MQSGAAVPNAQALSGLDLSANPTAMRILRLKDVSGLVGLRRAAIYRLQQTGNFPKSVKIGVRAVGWMADDVLAWIAQRANRPRSPAQLSEERNQIRNDLNCKMAVEGPEDRIDGQSKLRDGYGMPRHLHKELLRLRALEWRFRQITQLQAEIVALTKVSIPDERTVGADERLKKR